ncbi:MAG: acetyltransferase [Rufibacter sp.]
MSEKRQKIVIVGTGGLGREILMLLHQINMNSPTWEIMGFYDDAAPATPTVNGYPYLGTVDDLNQTPMPLHVAIAIGSCQPKANVVARLFNPLLQFPVLVHPTVLLSPEQEIKVAEGTIICQNCVLTTNISLGKHILLNLACTIGHDAVLGDFCSLMPQVAISGGVQLGEGVYFGTNSCILQSKQIGAFSTIGAGAVVTKDLPSYCTAVGVPAQIISQSA